MNDSEQFAASSEPISPKPESFAAQFDGFQRIFSAALVALLFLSVTWNIFLIRQTGFIRNDLKTVRPQISLMMANYQKAEEPQIKSFLNALIAFGQKHPDFNPILTKYKIPLTPVAKTPGTTPAATSAVPASKK